MPDEITPDEGSVATETPAAPNPGPWQSDLEAHFSDPEVRSQVDSFMREKVQPHTTQLEQRLAEIPEDAVQFYNDFTTNPSETYIDVTTQLYGDDAAAAVIAALQGDVPDPDETRTFEDDTDIPPARDPEVEAMLEEHRNAKRLEQYNAELARVKLEHADTEIDEDLFHPFVASAGGDFNTAAALYKVWADKWKAANGGELPTLTEADVPDPPNVIGSDALSPSTPPTQQKHESLDAALESFFDENRPSAPPTVGGV